MIVDLPTELDFYQSATSLLHSAFEDVLSLLTDFNEINGVEYKEKCEDGDAERYWKAANQTLASAHIMVQQGVEFYIKSRIVEISPYLLLSGNVSNWPSGCNKHDLPFSEFRTVDAQDLIKLHDAVCDNKFSDKFIQWYNQMRVSRNKVMHTVNHSYSIEPETLLESIFFTYNYFSKGESWIKSRIKCIDNSPSNTIKFIRDEEGHVGNVLFIAHSEASAVIKILSPSKVLEYFSYKKKEMSVDCPQCLNSFVQMYFYDSKHFDDVLSSFQVMENGFYRCYICEYVGELVNSECLESGCDGDILDRVSGVCIQCGHTSS